MDNNNVNRTKIIAIANVIYRDDIRANRYDLLFFLAIELRFVRFQDTFFNTLEIFRARAIE